METTRWQTVELGGMFEATVPKLGTAELIEDLYRDPEGYWATMPGLQRFVNTGSGALLGMHWFQPRPNQRWLVYVRAISTSTSAIQWAHPVSGALTTIQNSRRRLASGDLGTSFLEHGRWLLIFDELNAPVRWNGARLAPVGFSTAAPAPTVSGPDQGFNFADYAGRDYIGLVAKSKTRQRGVGPYPDSADEDWRYDYGLTMVSDRAQESPMSVIASISGTNDSAAATGGKSLVRVDIPLLPDHIRGCRLWRSKNKLGVDPEEAAPMYLVREFTMAGGFSYIDLTDDEALGDVIWDPDSTGTVPIGPRAAAHFGGSIWLGGMPDDPSMLRYSHGLFVEQFPDVFRLPVGSSSTGPIVAMRAMPRALVVFKRGGVYLVKGDHYTGFRVDTVSEVHGCAAPRAIEFVPGLGFVFLSSDGPKVLVGSFDDDQPSKVEPLHGIRRTWRRYVGRNLSSASSCYDPEHNEVWFSLPQADGRNTLGLVLHTDIGSWSTRVGWKVSCFARYLGRTWVASWDDTDYPGVWFLTHASTTRFGSTVTGRYLSSPLLAEKSIAAQALELGIYSRGDPTITVKTRKNREALATQTESGKKQRHPSHDLHRWEFNDWGAGYTWADYETDRLLVDLDRQHAYAHQIQIESTRAWFFGLSLLVDPSSLDPKPRRPRTDA